MFFDRWGDGERQEAVCEQMATEDLFGMEGQGLWARYQKVRHSSMNGTSPKLRGEMLCLRCSCLWSCEEGVFQFGLHILKNWDSFKRIPKREGECEQGSAAHTCECRLKGIALGSVCVRGVDGELFCYKKGKCSVLGCVCCGEEEQSWI